MGIKTVHFIKPKGISKGVFYSQLLNLQKTISKSYPLKTKLWVWEKDLLEGYDRLSYYLMRKNVSQHDIIYTRSPIDFLRSKVFLAGKGVKYLYDFRALVAFESWYRNKNPLNFLILLLIEFLCYITADQINAVSENLATKLNSFFIYNRQINVVPCLTDKTIKRKPNKKNKIKFVYIGGTSKWQCIEDIFMIYQIISEQIDNTSLTFYTKNRQDIVDLAQKYDVEVNCKFVNQDKIFSELQNYDIGFLIREENFVNEVASPIKFLEYCSAGVIPLMSNGIGDYSRIIQKKGFGILINKDKLSSVVLKEKICSCLLDENLYERMYEFSRSMTWRNYQDKLLSDDLID